MTDHPALDALWDVLQSRPSELHKRLTDVEAQQMSNALALSALANTINNLEARVSQTEDAIAELNTETNSLAARVDAILARDTALDTTTADELRSLSSRLKGIAADPQNPVPAPEPAPGDVTPEPAPVVDENGNPV